MKIHLIRHGHTEANAQKRYCGRTDLPLSPEGVAALYALKVQGAYPFATVFYTSGMLRARQTLALLYGVERAAALPELSEYDFGSFEMKSYGELRHDPAYIAWIADESGVAACPGGESKGQYERRVARGFESLLTELQRLDDPSAAAVVHGGTIVQIMSRLFPGERNFYEWQPLPGWGYTLCRDREGVFTYQPIGIEGENTP